MSSSEFNSRLRGKLPDLQSLFQLLTENKESPVLDADRHSKYLINEVARLVQLQVVNVDIPVLAKSFHKFVDEKADSMTLTVDEFVRLIEMWYRENPIPLSAGDENVQVNLIARLKRTIKEYKSYLNQVRSPFETDQYQQLISALELQLSELRNGNKLSFALSLNREPTAEERKGLTEIFKFYATQHQMMGKAPTFEAVAYNNALIDSGSFLHFCKDFGIYSEKLQSGKRVMGKDELLAIFKKSALMRRQMVLEGFLVALDLLADEYFNEIYNGLHPGPYDCTAMPMEQKRILMYELLRCGDPRYYTRACKPFGRAFSSSVDPGSRIPADDPSLRYRFRKNDATKERLLKYKEEKRLKEIEAKEAEKQKVVVKARVAQKRLKEKMEVEEGKRNRSLLKLEDLPNMSFKDLLGDDSHELDDLVDGSEDY